MSGFCLFVFFNGFLKKVNILIIVLYGIVSIVFISKLHLYFFFFLHLRVMFWSFGYDLKNGGPARWHV